MKKSRSFYFLVLLGTISSCQNSHYECDEVVCETVHRYGVPLEPQDWTERGQHGQVVSMRKDGVTVTRNYDAGVLHGECSYSFPHRDVVQKKEVYDRGALRQEYAYYPTGLPQQQLTYDSPTRRSKIVWYESGAPQCREQIENDHLVQGEYYHPNQHLDSRVDEFNGFRTCRDGQGELQGVDVIQNGHMVSKTTYHPNGTPATVTPYVDQKIEGQRYTYLPGGEPATVEEWTDNLQHGTTVVFEHGEKRADVPYVNGNKQGIERRYRDGQTVAQEVTWVQNQRHGPCYNYIANNSQVDWYFKNRQVPNRATYDMLSNR